MSKLAIGSGQDKTRLVLTFSSETRSAACNSVKPEILSTMLFSFGSVESNGGGGVDDDASVAVERKRKRLNASR